MISKEEIKKLADLARIKIEDSELESLRKDLESIIEYVSQVKSISGSERSEEYLQNVWREDKDPTPSLTYSKELIDEFPDSENGYLRVKKIL